MITQERRDYALKRLRRLSREFDLINNSLMDEPEDIYLLKAKASKKQAIRRWEKILDEGETRD
jgi:hypothetical protein